jgi:ABC-type transport system involved in cytochrome c biogenesis permease subunit
MNWISFPLYAELTALLWFIGGAFMFFERNINLKRIAHICIIAGIVVFSTFITLLWLHMQRPPLRTLGETRLWYSVFLAIVGYITHLRWRYKVILAMGLTSAIFFLWINYAHPEAYDKTLMPALQSPWFVPHVIVYILSYVALGISWLIALFGLFKVIIRKFEVRILGLADNMVYIGFSLLTTGMIFGALWAKEAWGNYWTWDPKETWAFLTWLFYLLYIHYRHYYPKRIISHLFILSFIFVILLVCWFGLSYLPSAQNSVHVYAN